MEGEAAAMCCEAVSELVEYLREQSAGGLGTFVVEGTEGQSKHILTAKLLLSHMCKTSGISLEKLYFESNL